MSSLDRAVRAADATSISLTGTHLTLVVVVAAIAVVALVMGVIFRRQVLAADEGTAGMQEIGNAVQEGAQAYLAASSRPCRSSSSSSSCCSSRCRRTPPASLVGRSVFFLLGAVFSAAIGYLGMCLAVKANVRVASAAREGGRDDGMRIAFRTGGTVGMATVGLGLLGASVVVLIYKGDAPKVLEGFGFGAALLAMFMRVGGGIFTKAADVGADLVGKVEEGIPEDDPRNAATIADNVGDNVGDCAGMAADLFESYAVTLVAALILGKAAFGEQGLVFPLIIPGVGALTAVLGVFITRPAATRAASPRSTAASTSPPPSRPCSAPSRPSSTCPTFARPHRRRHRPGSSPPRRPATRGCCHRRRAPRHRPRGDHPVAHRPLHRHDERPTRDVARTSLTGAATVVLPASAWASSPRSTPR